MTTSTSTASPMTMARTAGLLYVLLIPLGIFGLLFVPAKLVDSGDMVTTIENIKADELLFRLASVSAFATQLINLVLVYLLYKLLKPVSRDVALMMVVLIIIGMPIAMLAEVSHTAVLHILDGNEPSEMLVSLFLNLHDFGINVASIFWGLWLFPMGYLVFKSTFLPKIIGILLMIGCFGYLVDSFVFFLNPDFGIEFAPFLFFGEMAMAFWLLIKGVSVEKWQQRDREAAAR